jgi:hypothetical protein
MEPLTALQLLYLLFLLELKHGICDGPLQTVWMVMEKGTYGKPGGLAHAAIHGMGNLAVFAVFGLGWQLVLMLAIAEAVLHYHIDYFKESYSRRQGLTPQHRRFWLLFMGDQTLHHFVYLTMAWIVIAWR